jgi:hypothetical protein
VLLIVPRFRQCAESRATHPIRHPLGVEEGTLVGRADLFWLSIEESEELVDRPRRCR